MVKIELLWLHEYWCNKDQKNLCERSMSILVHHYFISLKSIKGNIWKFEGYIGFLIFYIISINYVSYMD